MRPATEVDHASHAREPASDIHSRRGRRLGGRPSCAAVLVSGFARRVGLRHTVRGVVQNQPFLGYRGRAEAAGPRGPDLRSKVVLSGGGQPPRIKRAGAKPSFPLADTRKWRNSGKNGEIRLENVVM